MYTQSTHLTHSKLNGRVQATSLHKVFTCLHYSLLPLKFATPTAVEANLRGYTGAATIELETC